MSKLNLSTLWATMKPHMSPRNERLLFNTSTIPEPVAIEMSSTEDSTSVRQRNVRGQEMLFSSNTTVPAPVLPRQESLSSNTESRYLFLDPSAQSVDDMDDADNHTEDVIIPKHLQYVSPKFNINVKEIVSDEAFVLLRVEAFTLVLLFCVAAAMFAKGDGLVIFVCILGAIVSMCGVQGSLRKVRATLNIFWIGLLLWTLGAAMTVLYNLLITDTPYEAAEKRCLDEEYVKMFGTDCATNMEQCVLNCRSHVKHNLIVSISVFGSAVVLILFFFVYQARRLYTLCIFPEPEPQESRNDGYQEEGYHGNDDDMGSPHAYEGGLSPK